MCTLTYFPNKSHRIITANRDESPERSSRELSEYKSQTDETYFIAREPKHGGTNMAIGKNGRTSVLLNGAFEPHPWKTGYRLSRGILLLKSLDYLNLAEFSSQFDFENIEPFTLVSISNQVEEVRWDGAKYYFQSFSSNKPGLWASAQLYSKPVLQKRNTWFKELIENNPNSKDLLNFHFDGGDGDPENDLVMNRSNLVQTVSISQVNYSPEENRIKHFNLIDNKNQEISW